MKTKYILKPFELFFIILNISTYKIFTGYASLFPQKSGSSAPISAFFSGMLVFLIVFLMLSLCEKKGEKSIIFLTPVKLRLPFFLLVFVYLIFSSASTLRFTEELIKAVSFPTAPLSYLAIIIISAVVICFAQGFDAVSRLHSIIIPLAVVLTLPILISASRYGTLSNLFPILGYGVSETFSTALSGAGLYGDIIILFLLFPFFDQETNYKKTALFALGTGIIINTVIITVFTILTPYTVSGTISHPFLQLVKLFSAGRFFQRIDGYFMYAISGCGILSITLNLATISYLAKQVFSLPKIRPLSYPLGLLTLFLSIIITNRETALTLSTNGLFVLFPIVLTAIFLILLFKRRKKI